MDPRNTVALVTGASRGLGKHIARRLAKEGVRVALAARNEGQLRSAAEEINQAGGTGRAYVLDVGRRDDVFRVAAAVREELGPIGILVNNAGLGWYKPFMEWSIEEIDSAIDVNLKGTIYATRAVLGGMIEQGGGQIVNIASDLGRKILPNMAVYVAAKHGVLGFAGSLLREVKSKNVRVMTLTPGIIDTYFGGGAEGTRDESWSLRPELVADFIWKMLTLPEFVVLDEVSLHPMQQDF